MRTEDKSAELYKKTSAILHEYIQTHRLRCTEERLKVLQYACQFKRSFSPVALLKYIHQEEPHFTLSKATVYHCIDLYVAAHIIHKLPAQDGVSSAEYEFTHADIGYMRFICTRCGKEQNFTNKTILQLIRQKNFSNFEMENFTVHVYGHCKHCRSKKIK